MVRMVFKVERVEKVIGIGTAQNPDGTDAMDPWGNRVPETRTYTTVVLSPVFEMWAPADHENAAVWPRTQVPLGRLELHAILDAAVEALGVRPGKRQQFYVDITPVPEDKALPSWAPEGWAQSNSKTLS